MEILEMSIDCDHIPLSEADMNVSEKSTDEKLCNLYLLQNIRIIKLRRII
jgi:hypothetical protein